MSNFVWETEEENDWEKPPENETPTEPNDPLTQRKGVWLLLLAVIALLTGAVIYNQAQSRIRTTQAAMRQDIISSHKLIMLAAAEQDEEMLVPLLSGRDLRWVDALRDAVTAGTLFDRSAYGLTVVGEPEIRTEAIVFNDQLDTAEVTAEQQYRDSVGRDITLAHTFIYRLGQQRWLWSPLENDFWGAPVIDNSTAANLELVYPAHDEEMVKNIAPYIQEQVTRICGQEDLALECPEDFQIQLLFQTDPYVLVGPDDYRYWLQTDGKLQIVLPTPTLFGRPVDETGTELLANIYIGPIITQLLVEFLRYECCDDNAWVVRALVDKQLAKMDIKPWPLTAADYERYFAEPFAFTHYPAFARDENEMDELARWRAYLLIDFVDAYTTSPLQEQFELVMHAPGRWIDTLLSSLPWQEREAQMMSFALSHQRPQHTLQTSLPSQGLIATCTDGASPIYDQTWQYQWRNKQWESLASPFDEPSVLYTTPDDKGLVWISSPFDGFFEIAVQYDDQVQEVYQSPANTYYSYYLPPLSFDSNYLTMYIYNQSGSNLRTGLLDTDSCKNGACQWRNTLGYQRWSPDETHYIDLQFEGLSNTFAIKSAAGETIYTGESSSLIQWLDNNTIVYRLPTDDMRIPDTDFMMVAVDDLTPRIFLTAAEWQAIPSEESEFGWNINDMFPVPGQDNVVLIEFDKIFRGGASFSTLHAVFYDWQKKEVLGEVSNSEQHFYEPIFAPHGRWLLLDFYEAADQDYIIDLQSYELAHTVTGSNYERQNNINAQYDWSADGNWLVHFRRGYALLYTPVTDEYYPLLYNNLASFCRGGGWY